MTRKFLHEMLLDAKKQHIKVWEDYARLQEARSKEQQIKGQQAMLDQKIKAEYDKVTKEVPSPSQRKRKKEVTGTGASPYQVYKAPKSGNYVPAPKRVDEEYLREFGEWAPIETSAPTNSATTTFGYFVGGEQQVNYETGDPVTFTYNGLDGIANYPTSITVDQGLGEVHTTNPPPFSQVGVQGYTAKLNPRYKEAQENYKKELKEWKKKEDANFKAIKDTLKSFGTSWDEMRASKKWVKKLGDGTVVAIIPTDSNPNPINWTNNVRVVKLKQCANASGPMHINYNPPGQYQDWVVENSEIQSEVYLEIGEQPKEPIESQYLMPRRTYLKDINPQLDASQEFAQKNDTDVYMDARVQGIEYMPDTPTFKYDPYAMRDPFMGKNPNRGILPFQDAVLAALQYAFGFYDPEKDQEGGWTRELEDAMLNVIANAISRGEKNGRVDAGQDYSAQAVQNIPAQALLNNFGFSVTNKGIEVSDRFNFGTYKGIGGAFGGTPLAQYAANLAVGMGDEVSQAVHGINPRDDSKAGFGIKYTIPWSRVPNNHPARGVKEESTWDKINRLIGEDNKNERAKRRNKDKSGESGKSLEQRVNAKNSQGAGGSPYQVFRAPKPGNYVPAPKRTTTEGWSSKYKKSIDCDNPKGFSQRAHCQGRKKKRI